MEESPTGRLVAQKWDYSITEILSDALGLVISLVGLVLTTQAATENSRFPESPAAVLSATGVEVVVGFILYLWGHSTSWANASTPTPEIDPLTASKGGWVF